VVDERHLPPPLHVGVRRVLLALGLPGAPGGGLLLCDADHHHTAVAALASRSLQKRAGHRFLVLPLLEVNHANLVLLGIAVYRLHVGFTDLPERCRGRDPKSPLPA
jgi:hypothetical protein